MFDQLPGDCGLYKLTLKTNHQWDLFLEFALDPIADSSLYSKPRPSLSLLTAVLTLFLTVLQVCFPWYYWDLCTSDHTIYLSLTVFVSCAELCCLPSLTSCSALILANSTFGTTDLAYRFLTRGRTVIALKGRSLSSKLISSPKLCNYLEVTGLFWDLYYIFQILPAFANSFHRTLYLIWHISFLLWFQHIYCKAAPALLFLSSVFFEEE